MLILDLYDGAIVDWSMDKSMENEQVINFLKSACIRGRSEEGLLLHSDRGVQCYCKTVYIVKRWLI